MPKATLLPNIIDIACSLPLVRSQFRVKFAATTVIYRERLPRTLIERETSHASSLLLRAASSFILR